MRYLLAVLIFMAVPTSAQQIYKCMDSKGASSYQQTPCPPNTSTAGIRYFAATPTPEPGSQRDRERQKLIDEIDTQIRALGPLTNQGKRELAASLRQSQAQLITGLASPARRSSVSDDPAPVIRESSEPTTVRDQYGNQYTQPPGSAFVTDQKTGKQCFKYGDFLKCD